MKSPKNYLILFLFLATVGAGSLAWQQYQELVGLRASALNSDDRADLQKRLWAAEKRRHELEASLAARNASPAGDNPDGPDGGPPEGRRGNRGNNLANNFMAMMEKPEIQKLMAIQQKAALDGRYGALFKNLNLNPAQLEQFKNLLVEKQVAMTDALAAARAQGINPRTDPDDFQKLIASAQADADASIKSALGDAGFSQYQQYQQTLPQRNTVNQLAQSLSYTNTPLSSDQTEQMVSLLAANTPPSNNSPTNNIRANVATGFGFGGGQTSPITNDAITQASSVLSATQVTALQQLQATQQAQAQLQAAMRNQFRTTNTSGTTTSTAPTTTKGPGGG